MRGLSARYGALPDVIVQSPEVRALYLSILRADLELIETYVYEHGEPLDSSIAAYGGTWDGRTGNEQIAAWRQQTRCAFAVRTFPGDHFFLLQSRDALLAEVSAHLSRLLRVA
jgi:medium-chain acyl-[acyl-carrier-protein] hydrolase